MANLVRVRRWVALVRAAGFICLALMMNHEQHKAHRPRVALLYLPRRPVPRTAMGAVMTSHHPASPAPSTRHAFKWAEPGFQIPSASVAPSVFIGRAVIISLVVGMAARRRWPLARTSQPFT